MRRAALVYETGTNVSKRRGIEGHGLGVWVRPREDGPAGGTPEAGAPVLVNRAQAGGRPQKKLWV